MLLSISNVWHGGASPAQRFVILTASTLTTIALLSAGATAQTRDAPAVRNLGVSGFLGPQIDGKLVAFIVSEFQEGGTDLNGDGDSDDYVLHVHDLSSQVTTNLKFASTVFDLDGSIVAFLVNESAQAGIDLNGDGDSFDQVAFVFDGGTGRVTNLGISTGIETFGPRVNGILVAIAVDEFSQGNKDLNNDGDAEDMQVLHIHNTLTGETENLRLATSFIAPSNGDTLVAFPVLEFEQGQTDLNQDGDVFDFVLHVYDAATGLTTNIGLSTSSFLPRIQNHFVAFETSEERQDLNGDGDTTDAVAFLYNAVTAELRNLELASSGGGPAISGKNTVIVSVDEDAQGSDLNGDGDLLDRVEHVYNIVTQVTTNLGLSSAGFASSGDFVAIRVWESGQGFVDLNGDGDTNDEVLHLHHARSGQTSNLEIASEFDFKIEGALLAFRVSESRQGAIDLNGDGDLVDFVVHALNVHTGLIVNLELAALANSIQIERHQIALKVDESSQATTDLNGDGDSLDKVLHIFNTRQNVARNFRKAVDSFQFSRSTIAFEVPESSQGMIDLNHDKDSMDNVIHIARRP